MATVNNNSRNESENIKELHLFADLLDRCLNLNPEKRCTPTEALKHPFINKAGGGGGGGNTTSTR